MIRKAKFNEEKTHRYFLKRDWRANLGSTKSKGWATFIMLNPSVADNLTDDKTVTKCVDYCKTWGYGALSIINLCSEISTKAKPIVEKIKAGDYQNFKNTQQIENILSDKFNNDVYLAWGYGIQIPDWLKKLLVDKNVYVLQFSKKKTPKHPLYLPMNIKPKLIHV